MPKTFLQAEWNKLIIINYSVDKELLKEYLPNNTELDLWNETCYVSLVGFMFQNTKLKRFKIPFHINFEEVNLRFYVRYKDNNEWKRGVVFIQEIVPRPALALVANTIYKENYRALKMQHLWDISTDELLVEYGWKKESWNSFRVIAENNPMKIEAGSEEEFITEHYWGYTKINDKKTSAYEVVHPKWEIYPVKSYSIDVDFEKVYGSQFAFLKNEIPKSIFLAEGSEIEVKEGGLI